MKLCANIEWLPSPPFNCQFWTYPGSRRKGSGVYIFYGAHLLYQRTFIDQGFCCQIQVKQLTGFCELAMALTGDAPSPLPVPSLTDVINDLPGYILRAIKARSEQLIEEAE